ncbi:hypothetical protein K501DRAFT_271491 [Backusella circina FSU 941]|nr:hypothetical protein K501DRAFT_271491 [Backusella circina FSU 941]
MSSTNKRTSEISSQESSKRTHPEQMPIIRESHALPVCIVAAEDATGVIDNLTRLIGAYDKTHETKYPVIIDSRAAAFWLPSFHMVNNLASFGNNLSISLIQQSLDSTIIKRKPFIQEVEEKVSSLPTSLYKILGEVKNTVKFEIEIAVIKDDKIDLLSSAGKILYVCNESENIVLLSFPVGSNNGHQCLVALIEILEVIKCSHINWPFYFPKHTADLHTLRALIPSSSPSVNYGIHADKSKFLTSPDRSSELQDVLLTQKEHVFNRMNIDPQEQSIVSQLISNTKKTTVDSVRQKINRLKKKAGETQAVGSSNRKRRKTRGIIEYYKEDVWNLNVEGSNGGQIIVYYAEKMYQITDRFSEIYDVASTISLFYLTTDINLKQVQQYKCGVGSITLPPTGFAKIAVSGNSMVEYEPHNHYNNPDRYDDSGCDSEFENVDTSIWFKFESRPMANEVDLLHIDGLTEDLLIKYVIALVQPTVDKFAVKELEQNVKVFAEKKTTISTSPNDNTWFNIWKLHLNE